MGSSNEKLMLDVWERLGAWCQPGVFLARLCLQRYRLGPSGLEFRLASRRRGFEPVHMLDELKIKLFEENLDFI